MTNNQQGLPAKFARPGFMLLLAAVATGLLALIIAPFAASLFAAAVMSGVLHPVQERATRAFGNRASVAAGVVTLTVSLLAVAPIAVLCVFVVQQLTSVYREVTRIVNEEGSAGLLQEIPEMLREPAKQGLELLGITGDGLRAAADAEPAASRKEGLPLPGDTVEAAAAFAADLLSGLAGVLLDLAVMIVALFFLLSQGRKLVEWIVEVMPLSEKESNRLVCEFRDVTKAVFTATVVTALIQTAIAACGYLIAGTPYLPIALLVTFVSALVPVVGAALITLAIGALFLLYGETGYGVFLLIWGAGPVALSDNVIKPWLTQNKIRLPGSVVLFAMIGGVPIFGPLGVIAGPLVVSLFLASLRLLREEDILPKGAAAE